MAADTVLTGAEAGAGHCGCGGFADGAASPLQTARCYCICTHQRGGKLAWVVGQMHIYGRCGDDTSSWVWDPSVCT